MTAKACSWAKHYTAFYLGWNLLLLPLLPFLQSLVYASHPRWSSPPPRSSGRLDWRPTRVTLGFPRESDPISGICLLRLTWALLLLLSWSGTAHTCNCLSLSRLDACCEFEAVAQLAVYIIHALCVLVGWLSDGATDPRSCEKIQQWVGRICEQRGSSRRWWARCFSACPLVRGPKVDADDRKEGRGWNGEQMNKKGEWVPKSLEASDLEGPNKKISTNGRASRVQRR